MSRPYDEEMTDRAITALMVWQFSIFFQKHAREDLRDALDAERKFVVRAMGACGRPIENDYYDECIRMDAETANALLEYVPDDVREREFSDLHFTEDDEVEESRLKGGG